MKKKSNYSQYINNKNNSANNNTNSIDKNINYKKSNSNKNNNKNNTFIDTVLNYKYIILFVIAFAVYFQTISYDFVNFDDNKIKNEVLTNIGSLSNISAVFTQNYGNFYRPLQTASFLIESKLANNTGSVYHIVNILFHILTCLLLMVLLKKLKYSNLNSFIVGVFYSIHPLFTHTVVWIPSRGDILMCMFGLIAFISFLKYNESNKKLYFVINILSFFLALLSKETAIVFPLIFIIYRLIIEKEKINNKQNVIYIVCWFFLAAIWFLLRNNAISSNQINSGESLSINSFIANIPMVFELIGKLFIPINMSILPTYSIFSSVVGSLSFITIIIGIVFKKDKRINYIYFGIIWFVLLILPVLVFRLPNADNYYDYLDHRAYLPMIGIFIILLEILPKNYLNTNNKKYLIITCSILIIFCILTVFQSQKYSSPVNYWKNGYSYSPNRSMFNYGLGLAYKVERREFDSLLNKSNLSLTNENKQELTKKYNDYTKEMEKYFLNSVKIDSNHADSYYELGELYYNLGNYPNAILYFNKTKDLQPSSKLAFVNLGAAYGSMGKIEEAISTLKKVLAIDPNDKDAMYNIYISYRQSKQFDSAYKYATILNKLGDPVNIAELFVSWGYSFYEKGDINNAVIYTEKALKIAPNESRVYSKLGIYYVNLHQFVKGEETLNKALSLDANNIEAYNSLIGYNINVTKNYQKAAQLAKEVIKKGGRIEQNQLNLLQKYMN